jgi:Uma2 family endonuclease
MTATMNSVKSQLLEMPDLPLLIQDLQQSLADEREKREYFYKWVTEDIKAEFINGKIIEHSPVAGQHWETVGWLHTLMNTHVGQADSGRVASEKAMISLTRNDYEPDIVFWKKEKSDQFLPEQTHYPAPDLVVEVLSKGTVSRDRVTKFNDYSAHGVGEYWIIHPKKKTIEQYLLTEDNTYELLKKVGVKDFIKSEIMEDFEIPVAAVFEGKVNLETLKAILFKK